MELDAEAEAEKLNSAIRFEIDHVEKLSEEKPDRISNLKKMKKDALIEKVMMLEKRFDTHVKLHTTKRTNLVQDNRRYILANTEMKEELKKVTHQKKMLQRALDTHNNKNCEALNINTANINALEGITELERLEKLNAVYLDRCVLLDADNKLLQRKAISEENRLRSEIRKELKEEVELTYEKSNEKLREKLKKLNATMDEELFFDIEERYVFIKTKEKTYSGHVCKETRSHLVIRTTNKESYEYVINKYMIQGMKIYRHGSINTYDNPGVEIYKKDD